MSDTVGIVIVSHSQDIAKGTADMVRQMVGSEVRVAFCGGNPDGGLGTNVPLIIDAINKAWSPKGVAVLVDLGGAETNSEMAVEMLQPERRNLVVVCNADRRRSCYGGNRSRGRQFARASSSGSRGTLCRLSRDPTRSRNLRIGMMLESRKPNGQIVTGSVQLDSRRRHARAAGGQADKARQEISGPDLDPGV